MWIIASPQVTINGDPNTLLLGGAAAVGGGLLLNHLLGDPAGKAVGKLINKGNKNRRPHGRPQPSNVEHHHHHYLPEPEYVTEEGKPKIRISNRIQQCWDKKRFYK